MKINIQTSNQKHEASKQTNIHMIIMYMHMH